MSTPEISTNQDTTYWKESQERVAGSRGYVDGRVTHLVDLAGTGGPAAPEPSPPESVPEETTADLPNPGVGPSS